MGKACSSDLRTRMVRGVEDGISCRGVADRFEVAPSTAVRLWKRYAATGSVAPMKQGRPPGSGKLGPHKEFLVAQVRARPDQTLQELAETLKMERGVEAHKTCIGKALRAAGFTYKKNSAGLGARARRREVRPHGVALLSTAGDAQGAGTARLHR